MLGLGTVIWQFQRLPAWASAQLVVFPELRDAVYWIKLDANKAQSFAPGTPPQYGTFRWQDYGTFPPTSYEVKYYLAGNTLYRQVISDNVPFGPLALARHIASQSHVTFTLGSSKLTTTITATIESGIMGDVVRSSTLEVEMRPEQTEVLKYLLYYLHNNPTPPTGNTASQTNLPLDSTRPTATTLYNYDTNRDALAGLRLVRAAVGGNVDEPDTTKFQDWVTTSTLANSITIDGRPSLFLGAAAAAFLTGNKMTVAAWLRDLNPATNQYTTIGTKGSTGFTSGSGWTLISVHFSGVEYTVPAGHKLVVKVQFDGTSQADGMLAYDTSSFLAYVNLPIRP